MKRLNRTFALTLVLTLCVGLISLAAGQGFGADQSTIDQRQEDLDYLLTTLEEVHPDLYAHNSKQVFEAKQAAIRQKIPTLDDFGFAIELQSLVALAGDSHTAMSLGRVAEDVTMLPLGIADYEGEWRLTTLPAQHQDLLGARLTAINGHSMDQVLEALRPFFSYDNEVRLRRQFRQNVGLVPLLQHYGILGAQTAAVPVTAVDDAGRETVFQVAPITAAQSKNVSLASLSQLREGAPATAYDPSALYKAMALDGRTAYIQYNACREDPSLPMADFVAQVQQLLDQGRYEKVLLDLRNNGGGSDGVLVPLLEMLAARSQQTGLKLYVLVGEATFSSAVINGVMAKQVGFTLVGEETSGSVNHFGAVRSFDLPHLPATVGYSTKYIDLSDYFAVAAPYGEGPLTPDIQVRQTLADYQKGVDTAVDFLLQDRQAAYELPYYVQGGQRVFAGYAALQGGRMVYRAPQGSTVCYATNPKDFSDVQGHWAQDAIRFTAERELLQGTGGGAFSPNAGMTRAMFVTVLGRLQQSATGESITAACTFADVPADAYYAPYVGWAQARGIVTGRAGNRFAPDDVVTREEMAVLLQRFAQATGSMPAPQNQAIRFFDSASISPWAAEAVTAMQRAGVLQGDARNHFSPQAAATRAEAAVTLQRLIETVLASSK